MGAFGPRLKPEEAIAMRKCLIVVFVTSILLQPLHSLAAGMKLEMIKLNYRTAEEIIPILRPMVNEGGSVSGVRDQLIVKTTPTNLSEIRQILASIDRAPRRLMITVKQDIEGQVNRSRQDISGEYSTGNVGVSAGRRTGNDRGISITAEDDEGNNVRYRNLSTRSDLDDNNTYQVQTLDGEAAFVQSGQQVPIANRNAYVVNGNIVVQDTIDYHDVSSGFYVLPRVSGDVVTLQVSPQLSRVQPNQAAIFDVQNANTTIRGKLGQWLQIGGIVQQFNTSDREILGSSRRQGQQERSIFVKVEEIH